MTFYICFVQINIQTRYQRVFFFFKDDSQKCTRDRSVNADKLRRLQPWSWWETQTEKGCRNGDGWIEKYVREKISRREIKSLIRWREGWASDTISRKRREMENKPRNHLWEPTVCQGTVPCTGARQTKILILFIAYILIDVREREQ